MLRLTSLDNPISVLRAKLNGAYRSLGAISSRTRHPQAMTRKQYLTENLRKGSSEFHWVLPITQDECSSTGNLFGGTGLAAAIRVLEFETHRPLVWITGQLFLMPK